MCVAHDDTHSTNRVKRSRAILKSLVVLCFHKHILSTSHPLLISLATRMSMVANPGEGEGVYRGIQ